MSREVIDRLWAEIEPVTFITRAQFETGLEAWKIEPVVVDGVLAFAWMSRGPEIHFASFQTGARVTREMLKARRASILAEYGHIVTRTPKDDVCMQRINRMLGFKVEREDEFFVHFRLEA